MFLSKEYPMKNIPQNKDLTKINSNKKNKIKHSIKNV